LIGGGGSDSRFLDFVVAGAPTALEITVGLGKSRA
jgi:hypothetical protein